MSSDSETRETLRLVQDRRNQFFATFVAVTGAGGFWVWFRSGKLEASIGVIFFSFLAFAAWRRLDPEKCFLLLTEDGLEEHPPFGRPLKIAWSKIAEFRIVRSENGVESVAFNGIEGDRGRALQGRLGDNYGFSAEDLVRLLNRRVASNRQRTLPVSTVID